VIEPLIAAALVGAIVSVAGTVWTLVKERHRAKQEIRPEGRITLTVGDSSKITLDASDFSREDLQAVIEALEDAHQAHDRRPASNSPLLAERAVVQGVVALADLGAVRGVFHQADEVNVAAARILMESIPALPEDQVICVATLPSHSGMKRSPKTPPPGLELFKQRLVERATTAPGWRIRHLLNFNTSEDLDIWLELEERLAEAPRYEARAYVISTSLPILAPLVVANEHVLLANEDPREARLRTAVHLQGRRVAFWATTYFDDLWDGAPYQLRSQRGRQDSEIERLRLELDRLRPL